jgi:hypothetical protein
MSYDIQLYRKEVKEKYLTNNNVEFFEKDDNLLPFTSSQKEYLKDRLLRYGYIIESENQSQISFIFKNDMGISVLLTNNGLYFSSTGEGIFEISMTASEFTDTNEFKKFDPQDGGWEEVL